MSLSATLPPMKSRMPEAGLTVLLRRVAHGDTDSLARLYQKVEKKIYAFALSRLGDTEAAADLVHEVMLVVWRQASSFKRESRALTWILGIAHHKILDRLRRAGRWREELPDEETLDEESPSPFEATFGAQRREAVQEALRALSDSHRQVVYLTFFEDLSYPEIARVLDIPTGTVKTRMFHAKKLLQRQLGPCFEGDWK